MTRKWLEQFFDWVFSYRLTDTEIKTNTREWGPKGSMPLFEQREYPIYSAGNDNVLISARFYFSESRHVYHWCLFGWPLIRQCEYYLDVDLTDATPVYKRLNDDAVVLFHPWSFQMRMEPTETFGDAVDRFMKSQLNKVNPQ